MAQFQRQRPAWSTPTGSEPRPGWCWGGDGPKARPQGISVPTLRMLAVASGSPRLPVLAGGGGRKPLPFSKKKKFQSVQSDSGTVNAGCLPTDTLTLCASQPLPLVRGSGPSQARPGRVLGGPGAGGLGIRPRFRLKPLLWPWLPNLFFLALECHAHL